MFFSTISYFFPSVKDPGFSFKISSKTQWYILPSTPAIPKVSLVSKNFLRVVDLKQSDFEVKSVIEILSNGQRIAKLISVKFFSVLKDFKTMLFEIEENCPKI
jgi:hypothetical protein